MKIKEEEMSEDSKELASSESDNVSVNDEEVKANNVEQKPSKEHFTLLQRRPGSSDSDKEDCNVHVVTRVRPLNPQELNRKDGVTTQFPGDGAVWVNDNQSKTKSFSFHGAFEPGCTQSQIFLNCGMQHLLNMALDGYACTAFAFGQTGSGKTYTMTGPVTPEATKLTQERSLRDLDCYGLIQFSFAFLMDMVASKQDTSYSIRASYLEIYNEQVQDLLNPSGYDMVQVRWSKSLGFYVENLFVKEIETLDDLLTVLEDGMKNRAVAEHNVNEHSSRSHSILTVYLDSEMISEGMSVTKRGKVSFVDLAGSEKVKDTGSTGDTLIEATNINRSLLTLGNCISALSDPKKRTGHIPFRDSKLTKLLADGLGGSGITLMIACVTPSSYNLSETLNTLRYAKRARKIKNKPVIRIDPREELILKMQREMKLLVQENRFLRDQLEFPHRDKPKFPLPNTADGLQKRNFEGASHAPLPGIKLNTNSINLNNITSPADRSVSDNSLYEMLQEYMVENEALRNENQNLLTQHSNDEMERGFVTGENDKLIKKLDGLNRLMMSTPTYGSSFFSRTTSGRSNQSYQTLSESTTPLSHTSYLYPSHSKQYGKPSNGFVPYGVGVKPPNGPVQAWNSTPPAHRQANGLPPLRNSPQMYGKVSKQLNHSVPRGHHGPPPQKLGKPSYVTQFKKKQQRPPVGVTNTASNVASNDIMKDFPMRDYAPARKNNFTVYQNSASTDRSEEENSNLSSMRNTSSVNRLPADFHVRFGKPGYFHIQNNPNGGGALPEEAYKPQKISPNTSMTKELSATSLRRLNQKMRQDMEALDAEINSYQQAMNKNAKKKVTAT